MFEKSYFVVLIMVILFVKNAKVSAEKALYTANFWELKPYIYLDESGNIQGMYPELMKIMENACFNLTMRQTYGKLVKYNNLRNWTLFKQELLANVSSVNNGVFWLPFVQPRYERKYTGYFSREIHPKELISVIVRRSAIDFPNRLLHAGYDSLLLVVLMFLLTANFGLFVGVVERMSSPRNTFTPLNGVWWAYVTVTTVGFGDFVPKTFVGCTATIVWAVMGLFFYSALTSFLMHNITSNFDMHDHTLTVLADSYTEQHAEGLGYNIVRHAATYLELFQALRDGVSEMAFVNADIALGHDSELQAHNLQVVAHKPAFLSSFFLHDFDMSAENPLPLEFWRCSSQVDLRELQIGYEAIPAEKTLHMTTIHELLDDWLFIITAVALGLVVMTLVLYKAIKFMLCQQCQKSLKYQT